MRAAPLSQTAYISQARRLIVLRALETLHGRLLHGRIQAPSLRQPGRIARPNLRDGTNPSCNLWSKQRRSSVRAWKESERGSEKRNPHTPLAHQQEELFAISSHYSEFSKGRRAQRHKLRCHRVRARHSDVTKAFDIRQNRICLNRKFLQSHWTKKEHAQG